MSELGITRFLRGLDVDYGRVVKSIPLGVHVSVMIILLGFKDTLCLSTIIFLPFLDLFDEELFTDTSGERAPVPISYVSG